MIILICECGQKLVLIGNIQGGSRMYLCLEELEITIKDKYDKVLIRYEMTWFLKWRKEKTTVQEQVAKLASEILGISNQQGG